MTTLNVWGVVAVVFLEEPCVDSALVTSADYVRHALGVRLLRLCYAVLAHVGDAVQFDFFVVRFVHVLSFCLIWRLVVC